MNYIKVREHQIMTNEQYYSLIQSYEDARKILISRLEILDHSLYGNHTESGPVHTIQSRIKSKDSIEEKLKRSGKTNSIANARDYLLDIAGIRIICYFIDDIYNLASALKRQNDLIIIKERDYIACPKPNGYRSYHLIIEIPVFFSEEKKNLRVEVQIRTIAMDFWASLDHQLKYKKDIGAAADEISEDLRQCAEVIAATDQHMLQIRKSIEEQSAKQNK